MGGRWQRGLVLLLVGVAAILAARASGLARADNTWHRFTMSACYYDVNGDGVCGSGCGYMQTTSWVYMDQGTAADARKLWAVEFDHLGPAQGHWGINGNPFTIIGQQISLSPYTDCTGDYLYDWGTTTWLCNDMPQWLYAPSGSTARSETFMYGEMGWVAGDDYDVVYQFPIYAGWSSR